MMDTKKTYRVPPRERDAGGCVASGNLATLRSIYMDPQMSKAASDLLLERHGIYIQPINYPTVQKGTEHLRITATPLHGEAFDRYQLCAALVDVWTTLALPLRSRVCIKPMRSWLVPCYEPTPPDPLACCAASLPARL